MDNASQDGSVSYIKSQFPEIEIVQLDKNYGFAEGNNLAIPYITTPFTLLLNTDVEVTPNWLEPLLKAIRQDPSIAAVQPKILSYTEKSQFEYAGASGGFVDWLVYPLCRGRLLNITEIDTGQYDEPMDIFWASGACILIQSHVIHEVGLFDAKLFAHMEEIDFCWRLHNAGYRIMVVPQSVVYHVGGGTLAHGSPRKIYLNIRNSLVVMTKNLPAFQAFYKVFLRLCLDGVAAIRGLFTKEYHLLWLVLKAHLHFYALLPHALRQRKKIAHHLPLQKIPGHIPKLMVWHFFIRKKHTFQQFVGKKKTSVCMKKVEEKATVP